MIITEIQPRYHIELIEGNSIEVDVLLTAAVILYVLQRLAAGKEQQ